MTREELLARAIEHVVKGEACIAQQGDTIERLTIGGHSTELPQQLLDAMLVSLRHMTDDRDHIQRLRKLEGCA